MLSHRNLNLSPRNHHCLSCLYSCYSIPVGRSNAQHTACIGYTQGKTGPGLTSRQCRPHVDIGDAGKVCANVTGKSARAVGPYPSWALGLYRTEAAYKRRRATHLSPCRTVSFVFDLGGSR